MKLFKLLLLPFVASVFLFSCSSEDEQTFEDVIETPLSDKGRFDNTPFTWDYSSPSLHSQDDIFVGDLLLKKHSSESIIPAAYSSSRDSRYSESGRSSGRGSGNQNGSSQRGSGSASSNQEDPSDDVLVDNTPGLYVGAAFPKSTFNNNIFDQEITSPRNPIDLIFDFTSPYIDEVTRESGSIGYKLALKRAMSSSDYKIHLKAKTSSKTSYSMTQFSSYEDIVKGFSNNTKVGKMFTAKVSVNRTSQKIESVGRLFARLENINFNTYMDIPTSGFFKNPTDNQPSNIYIHNISYGKIAYLAVESEYSYEKVKWAVEATIKVSVIGGSSTTTVDSEVTKILNKSAITIFAIGDGSSETFFLDGMKNLESLFSSNNSYSEYWSGFPIYIKAKEVGTNKAFIPNKREENSNSHYTSGGGTSGNDSGSRGTSGGRSSGR